MNHGVIEQVGPPLELFDDPRNVFVANFLGAPSINMIAGRIENLFKRVVFRALQNVVGRDGRFIRSAMHLRLGQKPTVSSFEDPGP